MKNGDGGYRLPEEIDPQRIQFCIEIPNDLNHIIAFWGALTELTKWWNWERDDAHTALPVTAVWDDVIKKARASFAAGECASEEICQDYRPTSARLTWFPESPFNPGAEVPDGYTYHPWTVVDNSILGTIIGIWGLGYRVGDVYTDLTKLPVMSSWEDVFENLGNMPSVTIGGLTGTGTVKLHFLNIPQGGRALIQIDDAFNPLDLQLIELNKDLISVPQETQVPIIIEVPIETDGDHEIKVSFLPTVDDTFIPIFFGGGFRGFEICGFGREGCEEMTIEGCCDETNQLLGSNNDMLQKIYLLLKKGFEIHPIGFDFPPDSINIDGCGPAKYDEDSNDEGDEITLRAAALCYVIYTYVIVVLIKALSQMGMPLPTLTLLFPIYANSPTALQKVKVSYPEALSILALITGIAASGATIDLVICQMLARLKGQLNSFDVFKNSLDVFGGVGDLAIPISGLVNATNQDINNWKAFSEALEQAMDMETEVGLYTCPCEVDCIEPLDLQIKDGRGVSITLVEGTTDLYHFIGTATGQVGDTYYGGVYVRDSLNRCLTVWKATDGQTGVPSGWVDQGVLYHHVIGCCGTPNSTGLLGGFAGEAEDDVAFTEFYWDRQDQAVDTYYHVKCYECP